VRGKGGLAGVATKQEKAEEIGLCQPGDPLGAVTYQFGQGHLHYRTWHSYSEDK
jgi:hypothetical protein